MSVYIDVYSLFTVKSNVVLDSEKLKGRSSEPNDNDSESVATTSMWTLRNFSISLILVPPLPIIDAMQSSCTLTLTRFSDKISTCTLESYFWK